MVRYSEVELALDLGIKAAQYSLRSWVTILNNFFMIKYHLNYI